MPQPNKSIEDVVEEIIRHIVDRRNYYFDNINNTNGKDYLTKTLTSLLQQSKEEEKERVKKYQIMIGNLVYNNESQIVDKNIKQILAEMLKDLHSLSNTP